MESNTKPSYYKVYEMLAKTRKVLDLIENAKVWCENIDVTRIEFTFSIDNGRAIANPRFVIDKDGVNESFRGSSNVRFTVDDFIKTDYYKNIINYYMDPSTCASEGRKPLPSYNCKIDAMINGRWRSHNKRIESFQAWHYHRVQLELVNYLRVADNRIAYKIDEILKSPEYEQMKDQALKEEAVQDILEVMKKYGHLGQEVLHEGLDQYVCHSILES